ncbi:MAG: CAP domain-containing protein [Deinococcales bacterium]
MKHFGFVILLAALLVSCPNSSYAPTLSNEVGTDFYEAINTKRQSASAGSPINCKAGGPSFPAQSFSTPSPALLRDATLERAAHNHADYMAKNHSAGMPPDPHNAAGDGTVLSRARAAGFSGSSLGEIMAFDFAQASSVITAWMDSEVGHCQVFMDPEFNRFGAALVTTAGGKKYWVVSFGKL